MANSVEYKGKTYKSLRHLITSFGHSYTIVMKYVGRHNITVPDYLDKVETGEIKPRAFIYNGVKYESLTKCVEELLPDTPIAKITSRKNYYGLSIKECLDRSISGDFDIRFTVLGKPYKSVQECVESFGLRYNEVYNVYRNRKLQNEMSIYEFLEKYFSGEIPHRLDRIEYDGKTYKSIKHLFKEKGIDQSTFYTVKLDLGYTDTLELIKDVDSGKVPFEKVTVQKPYGFSYKGTFYKSQNRFFALADEDVNSPYCKSEYIKLYNQGEVSDIIEYLTLVDNRKEVI